MFVMVEVGNHFNNQLVIVNVEFLDGKNTPVVLFSKGRDLRLERFIGRKDPSSQHVLKLILAFTLQKSILHHNQKRISSVICVITYFDAFFFFRLHNQQVHKAQRVSESEILHVSKLVREFDGGSLEEVLERCKPFLVYRKVENGDRESASLSR